MSKQEFITILIHMANKFASEKDSSTLKLSDQHELQLKEANNNLAIIHCSEKTLIQIELLFFDMLTMLRGYKDSPKADFILSELKLIHENEYKLVQNKHLTVKNRVAAIRKFKNSFRQTVRKAIKYKG